SFHKYIIMILCPYIAKIMSIFCINIILISNEFSFINCPKLDEIHHPPIEDRCTLSQQDR
ncbi:hypothetical protein KPL47_24445, partial [Clostridium estertheticum]|uniref:hypothetical protein n=1 Tax=Clostridium estertheticum TaxID=238834 RepID=UPI001C0DFA9B